MAQQLLFCGPYYFGRIICHLYIEVPSAKTYIVKGILKMLVKEHLWAKLHKILRCSLDPFLRSRKCLSLMVEY